MQLRLSAPSAVKCGCGYLRPRFGAPGDWHEIRTRPNTMLAKAAFTILFGAMLGLGLFTFGYARGASYLTNDPRSEEHTSELQSQSNLVCRLLLEKKNKKK